MEKHNAKRGASPQVQAIIDHQLPRRAGFRRTLTGRWKIVTGWDEAHEHDGDGRCIHCGAPWPLHPIEVLDATKQAMDALVARLEGLSATERFLEGIRA